MNRKPSSDLIAVKDQLSKEISMPPKYLSFWGAQYFIVSLKDHTSTGIETQKMMPAIFTINIHQVR